MPLVEQFGGSLVLKTSSCNDMKVRILFTAYAGLAKLVKHCTCKAETARSSRVTSFRRNAIRISAKYALVA